MSEDIKGILNKWKCYIGLTKKFTTSEYEMLRVEDIDKILDYITNLQQYYNDNVNKYEELLVKYSDLQEEIQKKEAMYDSLAVDYRLSQEENERLNNIIKKLENYLLDIGMPRDYLKELEDSDE